MSRFPKPDPDAVRFAAEEMAKGRGSREVAADLAAAGHPVSHMTVVRWAKAYREGQASQQKAGADSRPGEQPSQSSEAEQSEPPLPSAELASATTMAYLETGEWAGEMPNVQTLPKPNPLAAELAARKAAQPPPPPVDTTDTLGTLRGMLEGFLSEAHRSKEGNPRLAATLSKAATDVLDQIRKIEARKAEDETMLRISREEITKARDAARERFMALCDRPLLCAHCQRKLSIAWGEAAAKVAEVQEGEGV